jgi:hypothetical protein
VVHLWQFSLTTNTFPQAYIACHSLRNEASLDIGAGSSHPSDPTEYEEAKRRANDETNGCRDAWVGCA